LAFNSKIKDVITISSANFGAAIILGFFWFFLASILDKSEYGEIGYLMSIANVASAISILGLGAVILVYESKKENVFPASLLLILISSSLSGLIVVLITQNISLGLLIIGMTIFTITLSGLNSKQKFKKYAIHVLLRAGSIVISSIVLYHVFGIEGILFGYFIAGLFIIKELNFFLKNKKIEFSKIKPKIKFMIYVWSNRLSGVLFWWGDKIIIGSIFGFSMLGSYYVAAQFMLLMVTIPRALSQYLIPQEARGTKNKTIKIFAIIIAGLLFIISVFLVPFLIEIFLPNYVTSILPIQIMSIALIPLTILSIQESEFLGKENSQIILFGGLIQTGLYFLMLIILGQTLGLMGLALGFLVSVSIRTVYTQIMRKYIIYEKSK